MQNFQLWAPQAARGEKWGKVGGHVDVAKAQALKRRGRGSRPCNTESARGVWQTDFTRISKMSSADWLSSTGISSGPNARFE